MKKTWTVTSGEREHAVQIDEAGQIRVDGREVAAVFETMGPGRHGLLLDDVFYEIIVHDALQTESELVVHVNGRPVALRLDDEVSLLLRSLEGDSARKVHAATVKAPMPGRISKLLVHEGELIEAGQGVCILEAMKMENEIKTPVTGIVKAVRVQEGQAVEKNVLLVEIA
jgi:biotin carboxyl carrier protein